MEETSKQRALRDKRVRVGVVIVNYKKGGVFVVDDNQYVSFWYYIDRPLKSIQLQCNNRTQGKNFHIIISTPAVGTWTFWMSRVSNFKTWEADTKPPVKGDLPAAV